MSIFFFRGLVVLNAITLLGCGEVSQKHAGSIPVEVDVTEQSGAGGDGLNDVDSSKYPYFSQRVDDLKLINSAIQRFHDLNGRYPSTDRRWVGRHYVYGDLNNVSRWLPELVPDFIEKLPFDPETSIDGAQYTYKSDGKDYKLIVVRSGDCMISFNEGELKADPKRSGPEGCTAYGFWTPAFSNE